MFSSGGDKPDLTNVKYHETCFVLHSVGGAGKHVEWATLAEYVSRLGHCNNIIIIIIIMIIIILLLLLFYLHIAKKKRLLKIWSRYLVYEGSDFAAAARDI